MYTSDSVTITKLAPRTRSATNPTPAATSATKNPAPTAPRKGSRSKRSAMRPVK